MITDESKLQMLEGLRFPEFRDNWEIKKASEIFGNRREKGIEGLPLYSVTLNNGMVPRRSLDKRIENDAKTEDNVVAHPGDIVYNTMRMWQGAMGIARQKCMVSPAYVVLKPKDNTNADFYGYLLKSPQYAYKLEAFSYGLTSDRLRLYYKDFGSIKMPMPLRSEQEKIVGFLSTVDRKILELEAKSRLIQKYKKGLMQKIFSQQIRLKNREGLPFPDWEARKLGDMFTHTKGTGLSKDQLTAKGANKCVLYGELYTKYPEVIRSVESRTNETTGARSRNGDLLVPCSTTTSGIDLANISVLNEDNVLLGGDITILRFKNSGSSTFYAYYLTHFKNKEIAKYAQGSTIIHLYYSHFKNIKIDMPSLEEQQKIAGLLTTFDDKILLTEKELAQARLFKMGLLQKLFIQ
jgi:type I restriction enzyme S subunit